MYFLRKYNYFFGRIEEVKREFKSISWSRTKEIGQTRSVVIIFIFLTSTFLWIIDSILVYFIAKIT